MFKDVPEAHRQEAFTLAAQALYEAAQKQWDPALCQSLRDAETCVASFFPTSQAGGPPSAVVRSIVSEAVLYYAPAVQPALPSQNTSENMVVTVETAEAKRELERWIAVGDTQKVKLPRRPEQPWNALYPHGWVAQIAEGGGSPATVRSVMEAWHRQLDIIVPPPKVPELFKGRYSRTVTALEQWFHLLPTTATVESLRYPTVRQFLALMEQMLEIHLLCVASLSGNPSTATAAYWAALDKQLHSGAGVDLLAAVTEAKSAKTDSSQKNGMGRRH
jgi:hypothetical protein